MMVHSSHDSAIDTDSMEWETEVIELEKQRVRKILNVQSISTVIVTIFANKTALVVVPGQDMDLKALGFDIAEGVNDPYLPGDCGIFVSKVDKGSIAEGRLR